VIGLGGALDPEADGCQWHGGHELKARLRLNEFGQVAGEVERLVDR